MTEPLLAIGAFARAAGLTSSSLRHYDEVGLLPPADVDAATGYRYYTPDLIRRAQLIARMREVGLPIDTMRVVLDGAPDEAEEALRAYVAEQADRTARAAAATEDLIAAVAARRAAPSGARVRVDALELAAALRQVRAAADNDHESPLAAVLLDLAEGSLDVVATNRYWLAVRTITPVTSDGTGRLALGLSAVPEIAARLEVADVVDLDLRPDELLVAGTSFPVRDVAFPDHRALLDGLEEPTVRAVLARAELAEAIEVAAAAEVEITFAHKGLLVGRAGETGRAVDATVTGTELTMRLGAALIQRVLATCVGPEVVLHAATENRPLTVRAAHQRGFLALVMPIRRS